MIIELDHQIIPELPFTWRMALTQGSTGVVASPSGCQSDNIVQLAKNLIPIVQLIGTCTVNSWLRTPLHNASVGGAPHSAHLLGAAVDLHPVAQTVDACKSLIKAQTSHRLLFFEINTTNWLHLDFLHDHDFLA